MTAPKAPEDRKRKPPVPKARTGMLVCDRCAITVGARENDVDWPLHRCGYEVRPFARWEPLDVP